MAGPPHDSSEIKTTHGESVHEFEKVGLEGEAASHEYASDDERGYGVLERQRNPFLGKTEGKVIGEINELCDRYSLDDLRDELTRGARLAYDRDSFERLSPSQDERHWYGIETSTSFKDKWIQTGMMYYVASRWRIGHIAYVMADSDQFFAVPRPSSKAWTRPQ